MKHVLPRLVRPQMPGWPWNSSSSSAAVFLGWVRNSYRQRANDVWVTRAQELSHSACRGTPPQARHPMDLHDLWWLGTGPSAILVSGLHDDQLGRGRESKAGKAFTEGLWAPSPHLPHAGPCR